MKSFKDLISEVAQPKPEEEKRFKAQHNVEVAPHPVASETQHKGVVKPKAKRKADQEGDANYDQAYNESVEELDEDISKMSHGRLKFHMNTGTPHGSYSKDEMKSERDRRLKTGQGEAYKKAKAGLSEAEELEELSKKTLGSYVKKASQDMANNASNFHKKAELDGYKYQKYDRKKDARRTKGINTATDKLTKEEVEELDEISKKTLGSYIKKAKTDVAGKAYQLGAKDPLKPKASWSKTMSREKNIDKAVDRLTKEEVEQLAELSPNTLHSYIKKAAGNMAGNAAVAAAQASSSMKKSSPDVKRKIKNRMQGITGASGRLADKANADMYENWQEEVPMMMRQLEFISYAAEEIMDYVDMAGDPEEWFQNKISGIHQSMLSMYAYAQGGRRAGYGFDESVELEEKLEKETIKHPVGQRPKGAGWVLKQAGEQTGKDHSVWERKFKRIVPSTTKEEVDLEEALKGGQKKLDHNKNGKLDAHDFKLMRSKKMKEEVEELDEISKDLAHNYYRKASKDIGDKARSATDYRGGSMDLKGRLDRTYNRDGSRTTDDDRKKDKDTIGKYDAARKTAERKIKNRAVGMTRASTRMEEVELDEAFKQGIVKLKDGSSVALKKEDSDLLNQMFKDLSSTNRKKMQEVAMKDKAGFEEILGFAREAL